MTNTTTTATATTTATTYQTLMREANEHIMAALAKLGYAQDAAPNVRTGDEVDEVRTLILAQSQRLHPLARRH